MRFSSLPIDRMLPTPVAKRLTNRYVWVSPMVGIMLVLTVFPTLFLVYISLHIWNLTIASNRRMVGLENYQQVLTSGDFYSSLATTLVYVSSSLIVELVLGTIVALFIYHRLPGRWRGILQTTFLIPMMMSYIAVGLLWRFMWQPTIGVINYGFLLLGVAQQGWIGEPDMAMVTVVIADIWQWTPFVILIVLAGLEGLPKEPFEAAKMEGASRWQVFRYITFPMLRPVLFIAALFRGADLFRAFAKIFTMTRGGPGNSTEVLSILIYLSGFRQGSLGISSTYAVLMIVILLTGASLTIYRARTAGMI